MAKIQRKTQKIFAGNTTSDQITAFGTAKTASPVYTTDLDEIQTTTYTQGWTPSLLSDLAPYLQDSNALWFLVTTQLAYIFQQGIAEWDSETEYSIDSMCKQGENIYVSLQNNNINNTVSDNSYWKIFGDVDNKILNMLQTLYPVGSIYLTTNSTCPLALLIPNSQWQLVSSGKALWTGNGSNGNTTIAAGLPDHRHTYNEIIQGYWIQGGQGAAGSTGLTGWASATNSIYGNSDTVQPPAYVVNAWRRIS